MKSFTDWLNEDKKEDNALFIKRLEDAFQGVNYDLRSSATQIKNGTFIIKIRDEKLATKALEEWGIQDGDFEKGKSIKDVLNKLKEPETRHNELRHLYTVYSRGGIRTGSGVSDAKKFNASTEVEVAVEWIIDHYKRDVVLSSIYFLDIDKFLKVKSKYTLDLEKVKPFLSKEAYERLSDGFTWWGGTGKSFFQEISPSINFLCFLAFLDGSIVNLKGDTFEAKGFSLWFRCEWTVGKTPGNGVKAAVLIEWSTRDQYVNSPDKIESPSYIKIIWKELSNKDMNFEELRQKYKGAIIGSKFGL